MSDADARRLELAGFAAWRAAEELRQARDRFPGAVDRVAVLSRELEELARTLAGEVAMQLREVEERQAGGGGRAA